MIGEWKPIGVPHHHYQHHEDTQKEHFHHGPDGPDSFSSNSHVPSLSTHPQSPLDEEGLLFWNQLLKETHGAPMFQKQVKHVRKPKPNHHRPDSEIFSRPENLFHGEKFPQKLIANHDVELGLLQATNYEGSQSNHQVGDDFLSPPPAPHRFHVNTKPKLPHTRPKHVHKVHHKVRPQRPSPPPPPVIEQPDGYQIPAESSTFTCGHNHAEGTNYHTASYQVEGESDPALLADEITGSNYLSSPIIVGQPAYEHTDRFPKQENGPDLEEEGTETGDDEDIVKHVKQFSPFGQKTESSTVSDNLETTAPQQFHQETNNPPEQTKESSQFHGNFDHTGLFDVSVNAFPEQSSNERINFKKPEQTNQETQTFSSHFPASFAEFDLNNHRQGIKKPPPSSFSEINFPPFQPGKPFKIAVSEHGPSFNHTTSHIPPRRKRPHKQYEVNENSGEMIPPNAFFPPKKMPKQFDMRKPNFAIPKPKRPVKNPAKYQSTVHFDGSNLGIYQTRPRNKVTKIRLKTKPPRFSERDFRKTMTIKSRI